MGGHYQRRRVNIWQKRGQSQKNYTKGFYVSGIRPGCGGPQKNRSKLTHGKVVNCRIYNNTMFKLQYLLWRHTVLLTVGVYSSNHRVLYIIGISMTRRFKKV